MPTTLTPVAIDNQTGVLGTQVLNSDLTINLGAPWTGATVAAPKYVRIVLDPSLLGVQNTAYEVVYATVINGSPTATVIASGRGMEGTTAVFHAQFALWHSGPTAFDFNFKPFFDTTLGATTGSVSVSNIPAGATALELDVYARCGAGAAFAALALQFNGDAGNNYDYQIANVAEASLTGAAQHNFSSMHMANIPGTSAVGNTFGTVRIVIPNYDAAVGDKGCQSYFALSDLPTYTTGGVFTGTAAGFWHPATPIAITSLAFGISGSWLTGSRFTVRLRY